MKRLLGRRDGIFSKVIQTLRRKAVMDPQLLMPYFISMQGEWANSPRARALWAWLSYPLTLSFD